MAPAVLERQTVGESQGSLHYCRKCRNVFTTTSCAGCGASNVHRLSRTGQVYSYTTVYQRGTTGEDAFVLALVQLSEGPMVTAKILHTDQLPELKRPLLRVGLPVELVSPTSEELMGSDEQSSGGLHFRPLRPVA